MERKINEYSGLAVAEERQNTNCWGHFDNESCIHIKFGHPFKYSHFTDNFIKKYGDFVNLYSRLGDDKKPSRAEMLDLWKRIIALHNKKELVVIFNMVDMEAISFLSIAFYVIRETSDDYAFTYNELVDHNEYLRNDEKNELGVN